MRIAVLAPCLLVGLAACGPDGRSNTVAPDTQNAGVSGCEDPAVWTVPALVATEAGAQVGGGECGTPQLPLQRAEVRWKADDAFEAEQHKVIDRSCWRVTEASPASGWTAGQEVSFTDQLDGPSFNVVGFTRPVTVEGRALFTDGVIAYSIAPTKIELAPPMILEPDAASATVVMGRDGWAEHDAVHVWGQRIATETVLGGAYVRSNDGLESGEITLHQVGTNIVVRTWSHPNNQVEHSDVVIGAGSRAKITKWGTAVLVDGTELVVLSRPPAGDPIITRRVTLPAEPLEIMEDSGYVLMHFAGMLMRMRPFEGTTETLAVGDGVLIPAPESASAYFFDGTTFRGIEPSNSQFALDPVGFTPPAQDLALLGKPVGAVGGIIFGENDLLAFDRLHNNVAPGPASVSYADIFGDGHLGPLSVDTATYVIEHDNGSAKLYQAPYKPACPWI